MSSIDFPYMFWAHDEMVAPTWSLSLSGMPSPPAPLQARIQALRSAGLSPQEDVAADFAHPCDDAQPRIEAAIAAHHGVPTNRVIVTLGASSAMQLIAMRWFTNGARVAVDLPSYEPFRILPPSTGATLVPVQRRESEGWHLAPVDVAAAAPQHIFITNPNNPTGALFGQDTLADLHAISQAQNGILVVSETYMPMAPPAQQSCAAALLPRAISLGTMTKAYGFGAVRIGWIILGEELATERDSLIGKSYLAYVDPPTSALRLGLAGMQMLDALLEPFEHFAATSRPLLHATIAANPQLSGLLPESGLVAFPRVAPRLGESIADTRDLTRFLAKTEDLSVTPGDFFGAPGCIRLGFGTPREHLTEALARLERGLGKWHELGI